ncbi:MAG: PASTA domain-containing protein [Lactobacillus sp.]|nr:PASTA domain-containing protein [Lactobacillus sp.]MDN6052400.1 PASTA domain-containing protein [Lactobacillus sp.]
MSRDNYSKQNQAKVHGYRFTVGRILQIAVALVFLLFVGRFLYLGMSKTIGGQNISERTAELYTRNAILTASRGTIYDRSGLVIAEDSHLYTMYAILDRSSIDANNHPEYVVNKLKTANKLAPVLHVSAKKLLTYLTPKHKSFQVQFGQAGANLTVAQKAKIDKLKLPGIKFTETPSRLYMNGNFASHVVGLALPEYNKKTRQSDITGVMGLEAWYNRILTGHNGYKISTSTSKMQNSDTYKAPQNGRNLYLTLDSPLQSLLEDELSAAQAKYQPKKLTAVVEDIKTGQVLAASQRPTFNPQTKKGLTQSYRDVLVQDTYEPGSVFKILTLSAVINSGNYQPNQYYRSGSVRIGGATIHDWQTAGWGSIPFSQAFPRSSNVGLALLERKMGGATWQRYLDAYQLAKKTGVTLPGEQSGLVSLKGSLNQAVSAFGQGIDVNVMQMMQAFSALGNNGQMVKPQFVKTITTDNGKTISSYRIKKVGKSIYTAATRALLIHNMRRVLNPTIGTGHAYKMSGVDLGVKTGTAQIANQKHGGYLKGDNNYLFSVVGVYPASNPRYCVYLTMQQPQRMSKMPELILAAIFKPVMQRLVFMAKNQSQNVSLVKVPELKGKKIGAATRLAKEHDFELVNLNTGHSILSQSTVANQTLVVGSRLLVTSSGPLIMPRMDGWTTANLESFTKLTGIKVSQRGSGKVISQSISPGAKLKSKQVISVKLKE